MPQIHRILVTGCGSVMLDCAKNGVTIDAELRRRVDELLGPGNFRLLGAAARPAPLPVTSDRRRALERS